MTVRSSNTQIHDHWVALLAEGYEDLAHAQWQRGLQGVGNLGVMLERGWHTLGTYWCRDASLMSPEHQRLDAWLTELTWGPTDHAAHAKAQPNAQLTALVVATQRQHLDRWHAYWARGVDVSGAGGRRLIERLVEQRFGVGTPTATAVTGWKVPSPEWAQALDACLDRVLERRPPFPDVSIEVLGLCQDPVFGPAARHHLLRWVRELRHPGRLDRAVVAARHGLVMQAMGPRVDPGWSATLFQAWVAQGVPPTITVRAQDLEARRGLKPLFHTGHLRVTFDPQRSRSGEFPHPDSFGAAYSSPVLTHVHTDQTLDVAEHWFAGWVAGTHLPAAITPAQRAACQDVWRNQVELPQLVEAIAALDVPEAPARSSRARL